MHGWNDWIIFIWADKAASVIENYCFRLLRRRKMTRQKWKSCAQWSHRTWSSASKLKRRRKVHKRNDLLIFAGLADNKKPKPKLKITRRVDHRFTIFDQRTNRSLNLIDVCQEPFVIYSSISETERLALSTRFPRVIRLLAATSPTSSCTFVSISNYSFAFVVDWHDRTNEPSMGKLQFAVPIYGRSWSTKQDKTMTMRLMENEPSPKIQMVELIWTGRKLNAEFDLISIVLRHEFSHFSENRIIHQSM